MRRARSFAPITVINLHLDRLIAKHGLIRRLSATGHVAVEHEHQKQRDGIHDSLLREAQCGSDRPNCTIALVINERSARTIPKGMTSAALRGHSIKSPSKNPSRGIDSASRIQMLDKLSRASSFVPGKGHSADNSSFADRRQDAAGN